MRAEKLMVVVRLILGLAQMAGAVYSGMLLLTVGITPFSLAMCFGTTVLTVISLLLFRGWKKMTRTVIPNLFLRS
jgi:hypothetical protein